MSSHVLPPLVIAHRGASAACPPGNTVAAFRAAQDLGATWVELDVRRTADDHLVVHHDPHLPDGRLIVSELRRELPQWLPGLEEALDACDGLGVNIEIKNDPREPDFDSSDHVADEVVSLLRAREARQEILVSSFRRQTIDRIRSHSSLTTALLVVRPSLDDVHWAHDRGHHAINPEVSHTDGTLVGTAHDLGLAVNVWTVDDPLEIARMVRLEVDGIVTNVPDVAVQVISRSSA